MSGIDQSDWRTYAGDRDKKKRGTGPIPPSNFGAYPAWRNRLSNLAITTKETGRVHTSNGVNHVGEGVSPRRR